MAPLTLAPQQLLLERRAPAAAGSRQVRGKFLGQGRFERFPGPPEREAAPSPGISGPGLPGSSEPRRRERAAAAGTRGWAPGALIGGSGIRSRQGPPPESGAPAAATPLAPPPAPHGLRVRNEPAGESRDHGVSGSPRSLVTPSPYPNSHFAQGGSALCTGAERADLNCVLQEPFQL